MPSLEMREYLIRDQELRIWRPAVVTLRQPDLLLAQRLAVRRARVLLVRCAIGDVAVHDDQGWSIARALERPERTLKHLQVVGVADARDVPAVPDEARGHVIAERQRRIALDGDVVVVVDPAEVIELEVARQARRPRWRFLPSGSRRRTGRKCHSRKARNRDD